MAVTHSGDGWAVEVEDDVLIWEFLPEMDLSDFGAEAYSTYENLLRDRDPRAMVTVVRIDDPFDGDTFEVWERSAKRADQAGMERWAVVADGIKAISLRGKIDTGSLDTFTTEDRVEALDWARGDD